MRISLSRDVIRKTWNTTRMERRRSAGKTRHGKVEASPKEVHRADLSEKARLKALKHTINLHHCLPETMRGSAIIAGVQGIFVEGNWIGDFVGQQIDAGLGANRGHRLHDFTIECSHGHRQEGDIPRFAIATMAHKKVVDKVELDIDDFCASRTA